MKTLKGIAVTVFILAALGLAGTSDRTNQIIYTMPGDTYQSIRDSLESAGIHATDYRIAEYYVRMKKGGN